MSKFIAACAAVILAGVGSLANAGEYPAVADFRTYCMAYGGDPVAIEKAAESAGWRVKEVRDAATELSRIDGGQERSLYLTEIIDGGFRVRSCLAGLTPGSAEVSTALEGLMGREPSGGAGGYTTWTFADRGGKRVFLTSQEAEEAEKRGETLTFISSGLRGPLAVAIYMEMSKVGK